MVVWRKKGFDEDRLNVVYNDADCKAYKGNDCGGVCNPLAAICPLCISLCAAAM
jgi:hypothetical protein